MSLLKDSVFDPLLIQFKDEESIPYEDDKPILPKRYMEESLNNLSNGFQKNLYSTVEREGDRLYKKLEGEDVKKIVATGWNVFIPLQRYIRDIWEKGWKLGQEHALMEIRSFDTKFNQYQGLATFAEEDRPFRGESSKVDPVGRKKDLSPSLRKGRQPTPYKTEPRAKRLTDPLTNQEKQRINSLTQAGLNKAVEQRSLNLARDIDQKTKSEIKKYLLESSSKLQSASTQEEKLKIRKDLERQINGAIGRQVQRANKEGIEAPNTRNTIPGNTGFLARARLIANTELSAAYTISRLQAYEANGVEWVRWQSLEDLRVCPVCRRRNGVVVRVSDILSGNPRAVGISIGTPNFYNAKQYLIPVHGSCRCTWVPAEGPSDDPGRDPAKRNPPPISPGWIAAGSLSLLGVLAALAVAIQAKRGVQQAGQTIGKVAAAGVVAKRAGQLANQLRLGLTDIDLNNSTEEQLRSTKLFNKKQLAELMRLRAEGRIFKEIADLQGVKYFGAKAIDKLRFYGVKININSLTTPEQIKKGFNVSQRTADAIFEARRSGNFKNIDDLIERTKVSPKVKQNLKVKLRNKVAFTQEELQTLKQKVDQPVQGQGVGGGTPRTPPREVRRNDDPYSSIRSSRQIAVNKAQENYTLAEQRVSELTAEVNNLPRITSESRKVLRGSRDSLRSIERRLNELRQLSDVDRRIRLPVLRRDLKEIATKVRQQQDRFEGLDINLEATEQSLNSFLLELAQNIDEFKQLEETRQYSARFGSLRDRLSRLKTDRLREKKAHLELINRLLTEIDRLEVGINNL